MGVLFAIACSKTDKGITPVSVVQEESIKFTTNLDTGTYNVADTLPLVISVSSKIPTSGVVYSITTMWADSSKQIFKLDTSLISSSLSLYIPGLRKSGNYTVSISVTSKSSLNNTLYKSLIVQNNPVLRFPGYKVDPNARQLGENYWLSGTGVQMDLVIQTFQQVSPTDKVGFQSNFIKGGWGFATCGDFNNDGYVDVFTPGEYTTQWLSQDMAVRASFLLWDPINKVFKDTSLINDKNITTFPNAHKTVPCYLNGDNYVDLVIFPTDNNSSPVQLVVSDGKGGYDVQPIQTVPNGFLTSWGQLFGVTMTGGDIGDLNGDGLPDMVITANASVFIYWGIKTAPYFTQDNHATFLADSKNFGQYESNSFGGSAPLCGSGYDAVIKDVNHDGSNDILICYDEDTTTSNGHRTTNEKILFNQGKGLFLDQSVVNLPFYDLSLPVTISNQDYVLSDDDDIIATNGWTSLFKNFSGWSIFAYQKINGTYTMNKNLIQFSSSFKTKQLDGGKEKLLYYDYNGDGKKDIGYIDIAWGGEYGANNIMYNKTVFIKEGSSYVEHSLYDYDPYAKYMLGVLQKRFK